MNNSDMEIGDWCEMKAKEYDDRPKTERDILMEQAIAEWIKQGDIAWTNKLEKQYGKDWMQENGYSMGKDGWINRMSCRCEDWEVEEGGEKQWVLLE